MRTMKTITYPIEMPVSMLRKLEASAADIGCSLHRLILDALKDETREFDKICRSAARQCEEERILKRLSRRYHIHLKEREEEDPFAPE